MGHCNRVEGSGKNSETRSVTAYPSDKFHYPLSHPVQILPSRSDFG
jgi:hypothetical protein